VKLEEALSRTVEYSLRPRYAETDQMGVIYYANYLVWFECGRTEWLRSIGKTYAAMEAEGVFLPVLRCEIDYHAPARYDRLLAVRSRITRLTPVRLEFGYEVIDRERGTKLAHGMTRHAFVDASGAIVRCGFEMLDIDAR